MRFISVSLQWLLSLFVCTLCLGSTVCLATEPHDVSLFAFDVKFGAYSPMIDSSSSIQGRGTPFSDVFGDPSDPKGQRPYGLLTQFEFDYKFLRHSSGSLAVGISSGFFRKSGHPFAQIPQTGGYCTVEAAKDGGSRIFKLPDGSIGDASSCLSDDNQTLSIFPLTILFVYRFEYLEHRWHIPIIPFIRVGAGYWFWWFGNSNSFVETITGKGFTKAASGGTFGLVFHPGIAIHLGGIDREAGQTIKQLYGIHRMSVFIEMNGAWFNQLNLGTTLNLSDISFNAGFSFEF